MAQIDLGSIKFNWKGSYSGATAYVVDDVVESSGSSYICIAATTGNAPPNATYWEQMSSAGTNGTDGTDLGTVLTTQGDIVYRNASGLARLGAGTAGQALISGGTGANPSWGTSGGVLQVKSTTKTDTQSFSDTTVRGDITGLNLSLTPASASNKVLVWFNVTHWGNDSHCQIERSIGGGSYSIISPPTGAQGSQTLTHSGGSHRGTYDLNTANMTVLDAPNTTSSITYKITFNNGPAGGNTGYINRTEADENGGNGERAISTITAMEIASGVL